MLEDITILIILIAINGYFSEIDAEFMALNRNKIKMQKEAGEERAVILWEYIKKAPSHLAVVQFVMCFTGVFAGFVAAAFLTRELLHFLSAFLPFLQKELSKGISSISITLLLTYFLLVFGKFIPKRYGKKHAEELLFATRKFIQILSVIVSPFLFLCTGLSVLLAKLVGLGDVNPDDDVTREELQMLVSTGSDKSNIDESEREMIKNIFKFDSTAAGDIETHRTDIVALPVTATLEDVIYVINNEKYSRIPVYGENIDDIIGIFHVKDMMKYILNRKEEETFDMQSILMKPYFVPVSKKTDELFEEMQLQKVHMAIVIDEYGGTAGLVTMEDLLEEIVGNIFDEYDTEEEDDIQIIGNDNFLIKGTTEIDEVAELLHLTFSEEDYDTIGGFLIGQLGRIPEEEEHPEILYGEYCFKIERIEEKRIEDVRVTRIYSEQTEAS